jgi:hypothetical protein
MTCSKQVAGHDQSETAANLCALELPTRWTPEQAAAVFELLDDVMGFIWRRYGRQIE